jgi:transposase-like protein
MSRLPLRHRSIPVKTQKQQMDLMKLMQEFDTSEECRTYLEELRWPKGMKCPRCESAKISRIRERNQFDCDSCRYQFSVTAGSIFHDSHLPLPKWFAAVYLMCEARKGVSANQLKRTLGVTYKTAWYLCHRIRKAMEEANPVPLKGTVEVDETFVGGHRRGVGRGNRIGKSIVLGAIERGGEVRLRVEKRKNRKTLHRFIHEETAPDTKRIMTDEWFPYRGIADDDTTHETVDHSKEEWVRGDIHTNSIEGVWSLFKRSVVGSYHQVSAKHLDRYLDEFEFRFNNRKNPYLFRDTLLRLLGSGTLTYSQLTAINQN